MKLARNALLATVTLASLFGAQSAFAVNATACNFFCGRNDAATCKRLAQAACHTTPECSSFTIRIKGREGETIQCPKRGSTTTLSVFGL
jgi:hypothetical protein